MTSDVANFKLQLAIMEYLFLPQFKKVLNFQFHPTEESQLNFLSCYNFHQFQTWRLKMMRHQPRVVIMLSLTGGDPICIG